MAINLQTKDIYEIILGLEKKTAELYKNLYKKAKNNDAKKVFLKLCNDEIMLKDSYSRLLNNLPDESNYTMSFNVQLIDYTNLKIDFSIC
jgi:rubrerythrin